MTNRVMQEHGLDKDPEGPGSERSFGIVFTVVFAILGSLPLLHGEIRFHYWLLGISAGFLVVTFTYPKLLAPLNLVWFKFGMLLAKIMNPLIMGLLFFIVVTPMALMLKLFGKDPMRRKLDPKASSYWVVRDPAGPDEGSMSRQF